MDSNGLIFVASNETLKDKAWNLHNVGLPPSKIAKKLKFPSYFGNNFAALEDCLGDMTESTRVDVVRYRDDPDPKRRAFFGTLCAVVARVALENPNVHLTMYEK